MIFEFNSLQIWMNRIFNIRPVIPFSGLDWGFVIWFRSLFQFLFLLLVCCSCFWIRNRIGTKCFRIHLYAIRNANISWDNRGFQWTGSFRSIYSRRLTSTNSGWASAARTTFTTHARTGSWVMQLFPLTTAFSSRKTCGICSVMISSCPVALGSIR